MRMISSNDSSAGIQLRAPVRRRTPGNELFRNISQREVPRYNLDRGGDSRRRAGGDSIRQWRFLNRAAVQCAASRQLAGQLAADHPRLHR
jgi:hypothetical protein